MAAGPAVPPPRYFTNRSQVKPGKGQVVRFAAGRGYYAGPPVPAVAPNPGAAYGITPAQLRSMVNAEVSGQVNPERAAIAAAQAAADRQYQARQAAVQKLTESYRNLLSGIGGNVQGDYTNAGNSIADFAKGYSGAIQGQLDKAGQAEQGLLNVAGAPSAQVSAATSHLAAPVDALYGLAGAIPAGALAREGAAFQAAADQLPAYAVGRGQQNALALTGQQGQTDQQYTDELTKLLASVPSLRASAQNDILGNAAKQAQLSLEEQTLGLKTGRQKFDEGLATRKEALAESKFRAQQDQFVKSYNLKVNQFNARQKSDATKASAPDASLSRAMGVLVDANGVPITSKGGRLVVLPGFKVSGGRVVKIGSKSASFSPVQIQKYKGTAETIADTAYNPNGATDSSGKPLVPLDYAAALEEMRREGIPIPIAVAALNRHYRPGERGRPPMIVGGKGGFGIKAIVNVGGAP